MTHWTLSQQRRRTELTVEAAYNSDRERVIKLLVEVASSRPDALRDLKPTTVFLARQQRPQFRAALPQFGMHEQVKSALGVNTRVGAEARTLRSERVIGLEELFHQPSP